MKQKNLRELLQQMTLEEKIGQLMQLATPFFKGASNEGQITGPMKGMGITEAVVENTGSVLGASGAKNIRAIQEQHLKDNRLGIPLLFMSDIVHGYKTVFPIPLAMGSSWDMELATKSAEIAAKEASVSGIHVTFAPMVDLVRDPRWGRVMESTGEDPYLNSEFAKAQVKGFQGEDLSNDLDHVAACVKHFAGYGAPEGGRDYNTVNMSERQLREAYLPAYKAALDAGVELVMTAFNTVDGIPATGNKKLMRDLLREEWKFDGVLISDWGAVKELIPHGVAVDDKEAARRAILSGVDVEMMTTTYVNHLKNLIEEGEVSETLVDEAVLRILELKRRLGLFDNPYRGADEVREKDVVLSPAHREVAKELATKSMVLLKNEGVLPLRTNQKVALIGPFAENGEILGQWSWLGSKEDTVQLGQGLRTKIASSQLVIAKGCGIEIGSETELAKALKVGKEADVIVLALGEHYEMSGEAGSLTDIQLPQAQLDLVKAIKRLGKPTVSILFNGRPLDLHGVVEETDAVLEAWYPGTEGGAAIADLLYGDAVPSGKLTMSFPYSVGQIPVYYNHFNTGRPKDAPDAQVRFVSQYLDSPNEPLFPFGFGLSYTRFSYKDMKLSSDTMTDTQPLQLSVKVTNIGDVAADEIVQLYIRDLVGDVVRPLKELKDFQKVTLQPGEEKEINFTLKEEQLRYYHADLSFTSDHGEFVAYIGTSSKEVLSKPFQLTE